MGLFEGFVNPALVGGVLLAAVPLIIHLLNRQRHKPVPWAAMRFVLAAYKQTRRRVRLENLLLLLLRMAAVAALALAVARPFTGSESPLGGLTESRRDLAIVIDASASTGYQGEIDTVFERILVRARNLVEELDGGRGDRVHLVLGGSWPRLLSWGDPSDAKAALDALQEPTDEELDLALALGEVLEFAREEAASTQESRVEVHVLTDVQRNVFTRDALAAKSPPSPGALLAEGERNPEEGAAAGGLFEVLDQMQALGLVVQVEDLAQGGDLPANLSVHSLGIEGPHLGQDTPVEVRVTVTNHGADPKPGVRVALEIDGVRRPSQVVDLAGEDSSDAIFPVVFDTAGDHILHALLEGDRLAADDERTRVVRVPEAVRILVVNGGPSPDFETDAASRLMVVLEPLVDEDDLNSMRSPFAPIEVPLRDLESGDVNLSEFDLVWLVDVESLSSEITQRLEEEVAGGTSLMLSLGQRTSLENFNQRLFRADGSGLAPAELERRVSVASRRQGYWRIAEFVEDHPALSLFAEDRWKSLLTEAPFYELVAARPMESSTVLARLDDAAGSPLFMERRFDRGKVFLWTSSFEELWTGFPTWGPALVPFVYDFVRHAGLPAAPPNRLKPGDAFAAEVDSFPRRIELVLPGDTRRLINAEAVEVSGDRWRLPTVEGEDTARAGAYRIVTEGAGELAFAVQIAPEESRLARLGPGELDAMHGALALFDARHGGEAAGGLPPRRGELWRGLALAALLALVAESLWSALLGRRRKKA
jgi:hypothetical protein